MNRYQWAAVLSMVGIICGCQTYKVQSIPSTPITQIQSRVQVEKVTVAADPCRTGEACNDIFHYPMIDKGYLPVLLVIQNDSSEAVQIFREKITLVSANGEVLSPLDPAEPSGDFGRSPLAEAVLFFGVFSYANANEYNTAMMRDWSEKGMKEIQYAAAGQSARRYLYFKIGKGSAIAGSCLRGQVQAESGGKANFEIKMN